MSNVLLTVMTPTYNRAHTLPTVYESLCQQTDQRFCWLIIDDGSTDETEKLVESWISEAIIKIQYIKKPNGGKASALNVGIGLLESRYATCLDSDDTFYPQTVEIVLGLFETIKDDNSYCGILALRNRPNGSAMGRGSIPKEMDKVKAEDIFLRLYLRSELICFYKSEILKQYRFPEFEGEKFVSPSWMQYAITRNYYFKTSWDKLCCCEYQSDGLTRNKRKIIKNNPRGYSCVKLWSFNLSPNLKLRVKNGIMYDCGCILSKDKDWLKNVKHKPLAVLLYPIGWYVSKTRFR